MIKVQFVPHREHSPLMMFSKIIAGYCENHGNHTNAVCSKCRSLNVVVHMFITVL